MNHIGTKPIETSRLLLRRFTPDDAQAMFTGWAGDKQVTRYLTWEAHTDLSQSQAIVGIWVEIGYCMSRALWGRGIMTEALTAVEDYLFTAGFNRIAACHHVDNPASGRVMQKSGMTFEGVRRQSALDNRVNLCDVACYAILQGDRAAQAV